MWFELETGLLAFGLFLGMLALFEAARWIGRLRIAIDAKGAAAGIGTIEGAVFGLMGLLLAFSFSGASARFDARRQLIIEESNAISTAYLRLDLLPTDTQPGLRELFRRYLDSRLETYRVLSDVAAAERAQARSAALQGEIWARAVAACGGAATPAPAMLLLPALNEMFDITIARAMANWMHPPLVVFVLLFGVALTSALLAGYGMALTRRRSWIHMVGFAAALAGAVYVTIDLEYPRRGFIRVDAFDRTLVELRQRMQ